MKIFPTLPLALFLAWSAQAADYSLPPANQGKWRPGVDVGVEGGIEQYRPGGAKARTKLIDVTNAPYNADKTGATPCQAAVQAALDAASANDVIFFPAGTYKLTASIYIESADSNKTFRGAGPGITIIHGSSLNPMFGFAGGGYASGSNAQTVTGTKTKGTTALAVASAAAYPVGTLCTVLVENEEDNARILATGAAPTWSNSGFRDIRAVLSRVTANAAGWVTVTPPLPWDCTAYATRLEKGSLDNRIFRLGFEDFSVTFDQGLHPPFAISMDHGVESWAYNVNAPEWKKSTSSGSIINIDYSHRCEVRKCDFRTLAPAAYSDDGAIQILNSSCLLIEDNIALGWDAGLYNSGRTYNCLIAYNYFDCDRGAYAGHNGHNSLDLYEGNVMPNFQLDGYHGSGSHMNFYRNWLYNGGSYLNRFMYYIAMVGNVYGKDGAVTGGSSYGNPNMGNSAYTGTANHFTGDPHADWGITGTLTTRTSDTEGVITASGGDFDASHGGTGRYITAFWNGKTNVRYQMPMNSRSGKALTVSAGFGDKLPAQGTTFTKLFVFAQGYQELDLGVEQTAIRIENYLASAGATGGLEFPTSDSLLPSLAHLSKPAWFGDRLWPPVNPDAPNFSVDIIPAGYRFKNGVNPPGITTPTPVTRPAPVSGLRKSP